MPTIVLANPLCSYHASILGWPKGLPSRRPTYPATATHQLAAWPVIYRRGCLPVACSIAPTNLPAPPPKLQPAQPRLVGCMLILIGVMVSLMAFLVSILGTIYFVATRLERINVVQESYNRLETTIERSNQDINKRLDQKFSELKTENEGIRQQLTVIQQDLYYIKGYMEGSKNVVDQKSGT